MIQVLKNVSTLRRGLAEADNVRVIPDAGDVVTVGADTIAKLSAQTSGNRSVAAWDQRIVIQQPRAVQANRVFSCNRLQRSHANLDAN